MDKGELRRAKASEKKWIANRWPLIERNMVRREVMQWLQERQYPYRIKSSCIYCPFRDDAAWQGMKDDEPDDFALACDYDQHFRSGFEGMEGEAFVHWSRVPLAQADFRQEKPDDGGLFNMSECEARCDG